MMTMQDVRSAVNDALQDIFPKKAGEQRAAAEKERAELIRQAAELIELQKEDWIKHSTTFNKTAAKLEALRKQLQAAETECQRAHYIRYVANFGYDRQVDRIRNSLTGTAPAVIAEAIAALWRRIEKLRKPGTVTYIHEKTGRQDHAGNEVMRVLTNRDSVSAHGDGIRAAITAIEELQLTAASESEANEAITKIKAAIPAIGDPVAVQ